MPAEQISDGRPQPRLAGARIETVRLAPVSSSASSARVFVREHLGVGDPQTLDSVLLIATELVTNAVLHARTSIDLTLEITAGTVLVRVFDCEAVVPQQRPYDVDRTDGRGIALVSMVSQDWGTQLHDGGKTVWAVIDRP